MSTAESTSLKNKEYPLVRTNLVWIDCEVSPSITSNIPA